MQNEAQAEALSKYIETSEAKLLTLLKNEANSKTKLASTTLGLSAAELREKAKDSN